MKRLKKSTELSMMVAVLHVLVAGAAFGESELMTPLPVSGRPVSPEAIIPGDVLARVQLFREELEAIRFEMGKPKDPRVTRFATNASPHEVYFQAITLYLKADRLALELTGSTGMRPHAVAPSGIRPYHTWLMVNAAYRRLLTIEAELGIHDTFSENNQPPSTKPNDVGRAIVQANRQLNLLLKRRFSSSDVSQQVTAATHYARALLAYFPDATISPLTPALERGKQPGDVFLRLVKCFERLEELARLSGIGVLHLDGNAARRAVRDLDIRPSDVYDLATLLVSDLAYLYGNSKRADPVPDVPFPGRKFPSHVYQQAGILLAYLQQLAQQVEANPNWLSPQEQLK